MNAPRPLPHSPAQPDPRDVRDGRRLMIGLLVVFFGLMLVANGAIVYLASTSGLQIDPTYDLERR